MHFVKIFLLRTALSVALGCTVLACGTPSASSAVAELWVQRYNSPADYQDLAGAVALDSGDNVVVTGYSNSGPGNTNIYYTAKYAAADGSLLWKHTPVARQWQWMGMTM